MRSFAQILSESKKVYPFKIGIAGELPADCVDEMKSSLQKFGLESISSGKKTPIQKKPLDFPQLENCEVTYFDIELSYPTIPPVLHEYLSQCCGIHSSMMLVRNANDPVIREFEPVENKPYETLLTTHELGCNCGQHAVGQNRIMELFKELEIARKEGEQSPMRALLGSVTKPEQHKENATSVVGSKK